MADISSFYMGYGLPLSMYAQRLLDGETDGWAMDATVEKGAVAVKDTTTPSNNLFNADIDNSNIVQLGTSPSLVKWNSTPYLRWTRHNLLTYSDQFDNAAWTKNFATVTANATTAPDGTSTADFLKEDATAASVHSISQLSIPVVTGAIYTFSVYIKQGVGTRWAAISTQDTTTGLWFNPNTGALGTAEANILTSSVTSVGSGWYRVSLSWAPTTTTRNINIYIAEANNDVTFSGDNASGIYIWGAHVHRGNLLQTYKATTSAAFYGMPQEYDSARGLFGMRLERSATNLCLRSQEFNNASWSLSGVSAPIADTAVAPDGTTTADTIDEGNTSAVHSTQQNLTTVTATLYTCSVYVKMVSIQYICITLSSLASSADWFGAVFDLTGLTSLTAVGGTGTTVTRSSIETIGDGWYRISVSGTHTATGTTICYGPQNTYTAPAGTNRGRENYTGSNRTYYQWGAQVELGTVAGGTAMATSYIQTVAATATRSGDGCSLPPATFPNSGGTGPISVYIDLKRFLSSTTQGSQRYWYFSRGTTTDVMQVRVNASLEAGPASVVGNVVQTSGMDWTEVAINTRFQHTGAIATNNFGSSLDGGTELTDTSGTVPTLLTSYVIGGTYTPSEEPIGYIYRVVIVPRRVANTPTWRYNFS